jgi:O-antigen/teichoic acid export membrane protein
MRNGVRDTAVAFGTRLAVFGISVGIQSALAWLLGPDGRGAFAVCLLFATLLPTIFTFGTDRAGQYFTAARTMRLEESVWATIVAILIGTGLAVAAGRTLMALDLPFFEKAPRQSFYLSFALMPVSALNTALVLLLIGLRRFTWFAVVSIANAAAQLLVTLLLVAGFGLDVNGALLAVLAGSGLSLVLCLRSLSDAGALGRARMRRSHFSRLLSYGIKYYVARLSNLVHFRVGTIILSFFAVPADIGFFAAASGLVSRIIMVPDAIEAALFSRVAGDSEGRPELVCRAGRISALVCGVALLVLSALARPAVATFLSPEFLPAVVLVWIMAPGVFMRCASKVLMSYFRGTDRPAVCSWSVGLGVVVNLVALVVLLPLLGLPGAAVAMTAGYVTSSLILIVSFGRAVQRPLGDVWLLRWEDVRILRELGRGLLRRQRSRGPRD